ncbi:unnamed protein product [Somion occarium]|uniref:Uncharacterized protein n=2 Tax=Somion occarium TaxID=3059160 RepID=A0ABP1D1J8_9APHY
MDAELSDGDPEFSQDLVRILTKELKLARKQLRESDQKQRRTGTVDSAMEHTAVEQRLKDENAQLQEENAHLRTELDQQRVLMRALQENPDDKGGIVQPAQEDHLRSQVASLEKSLNIMTRERDKMLTEHEENSANVERANKYKDKYRSFKEESLKSLDALRGNVAKVEAQRDAALSEAQQLTESVAKFNPKAFIEGAFNDDAYPQDATTRRAFLKSKEMKLPKNVVKFLTYEVPLQFHNTHGVWIGPSSTHFLAVSPVYVYDPKAFGRSEGGFRPFEQDNNREEHVNRSRDLFYCKDRHWRYHGIYEYLGSKDLTLKDVRNLNRLHSATGDIHIRSIRSPDMVAPNIKKMIKHMYSDGVLTIRCSGFRRIGFNKGLSEALHESSTMPIPIPGEGSSQQPKRKKPSTDEQESRPVKKKK